MVLTLVPSPVAVEQPPRFGTWVKISVSLMLCGAIALATAGVVGVQWYYGLHRLVPTSESTSAQVSVGQPYLIDELVAAGGGTSVVNLRSVSVRLGVNTAGATATVETCTGASSVTACIAPAAFRAGLIDLTATRIVVVVRGARAGDVRVDGVQISYRAGVRAASQHVGPDVTLAVR